MSEKARSELPRSSRLAANARSAVVRNNRHKVTHDFESFSLPERNKPHRNRYQIIRKRLQVCKQPRSLFYTGFLAHCPSNRRRIGLEVHRFTHRR